MKQDLDFGPKFARFLRGADDADAHRRTSRLRMSQAGSCLRKIAFEAIGYEPDLEQDDDTSLAFAAGDVWHSMVQTFLRDEYGCEIEVECALPIGESGELMYGHADALSKDPDGNGVVFEIKTMKSYAWDLAVTGVRGSDPEGPKDEHYLQASLYAEALGVDNVCLVYVRKEDGATAAWWDEREFTGPWLDSLSGILSRIESDMLPARIIGKEFVEEPPKRGTKGQPWQCRFCPFQPTCATLPIEACEIPKR